MNNHLISSNQLSSQIHEFNLPKDLVTNYLGRDVAPIQEKQVIKSLKEQTQAFKTANPNAITKQNLTNYKVALHNTIQDIDQRIALCSQVISKNSLENVRTSVIQQLSDLELGPEKIKQFEQLLEEHFKPDDPGCSLVIMQGGELLWEKTVGMADPIAKKTRDPNTPQHFGSVSKQFTAMCVAILVDQGKIDLEEDIREAIPAMKDCPLLKGPDGKPVIIRVKDLLHMQSGLPESVAVTELNGLPDEDTPDDKKIALVKNYLKRNPTLSFEPGKKYSYCNTNYHLLAQLVEARCEEKSFREFAKKHIFEPLHMQNSLFIAPDSAVEMLPGYTKEKNKWKDITTHNRGTGACGVVGTAKDMAKWDQNFTHPTLGRNPQHVLEILRGPDQPLPLKEGEPTFNGPNFIDTRYIGGLTVGKSENSKYVIEAHPGGIEGFGAFICRIRDIQGQEKPLTVFMAFNREHGSDNPTRIVNKILEICTGEKLFKEAPSPGMDSRSRTVPLDKFVGAYRNPLSGGVCKLAVFEEEGKKYLGLVTRENARPLLVFVPTKDGDVFEASGAKIKFIRSEGIKTISFEFSDEGVGLKDLKFYRLA